MVLDNAKKGIFTGIGSICLMSSVPVTIKWVQVDPWVIGTVRLILAVAVLLLFMPAARSVFRLPKRELKVMSLLGFFFALHWITYFFSIKLGTATMAVVAMISFYGIFNSIFGAIFLGHHFRLSHALGLVICTAGTFMTMGEFEKSSSAFLGFLIGILSGLSFALLPVIHQKAKHLGTHQRSFMQFFGALILFVLTIPIGDWSALRVSDGIGLLYLGTIGTVVSHSMWVYATTELPTTISSIIKYLYIPLTAMISYIVLGEQLTLMQASGAAVIIAGSFVAVFGKNLRLIRTR